MVKLVNGRPDAITRFADALIAGFYGALPQQYSVRYSRMDEVAAELRVQFNRPEGRYETRVDILFGKNEEVRVRFLNSLQHVHPRSFPATTTAEEVVRIVTHELLKERRK